MARRVPSGQLALFDDLPKAPPPNPAAIPELAGDDGAPPEPAAPVELFSPEVIVALETLPAPPPVPDRLALVIPVSSKSGSAVAAAARQVELSADALLSLSISVLDFGGFDDVDSDELEAIVEACSSVEMRRFEAVFSALGNRDDGLPALFADDGALLAFADLLRGALRERGAPAGEADWNGPHLPLDSATSLSGQISLDRPLKLPVRDFALVRVFGDGGYEVQRKWGLAL